ncbi:AtuA-related protein [Halorarius litoreus]|uniref:AtuA-related protein n=1 Tax=Halorarius litoreus TaxID=2962676 RepID=UPI0020CCF63E|nr:hypothetical protein [Halorarius litoreus]
MSDWTQPVKIGELAHARSGDKGDRVNIGVISKSPDAYERLDEQLTADRVADYFDGIVHGEVERYRLENVQAFNFVGTDALDGGGQVSLRYDTQGKTYAALLLECELPPVGPTETEPDQP